MKTPRSPFIPFVGLVRTMSRSFASVTLASSVFLLISTPLLAQTKEQNEIALGTMKTNTKLLPKKNLDTLEQIRKDKGLKLGPDVIKVTEEEYASLLKAIGQCSKDEASEIAVNAMVTVLTTRPAECRQFILPFHLTEKVLILVDEPSARFKFSQLTQAQRNAVWKVLGVFGKEKIFSGLPYEISGEEAKQKLSGKAIVMP